MHDNNQLYALGGFNGSYLDTNEKYNWSSNTWLTQSPLTFPRRDLAAAFDENNGKIYVMGGFDGSYISSNVEYTPGVNTWTTKASMPTARAQHVAVTGLQWSNLRHRRI